jgi:transposase, IS5 family
MIRYRSQKQLTLAEFDWPFQFALDEDNRWVKLSECIPWDEMAEGYYQGMSKNKGRPGKDARLVIGAVIIKHKLCLSDEETVAQIQENPYLQYFVGLPGYQQQAPFAPSLFVDILKRMGDAVFEVFQQALIDAVEAHKSPRRSTASVHVDAPTRDKDDEPPSGGSPESDDAPDDMDNTSKGKLILDATVAPQAIRYPTDLSLLNEARAFSEQIIDQLFPHSGLTKKPRTYRV